MTNDLQNFSPKHYESNSDPQGDRVRLRTTGEVVARLQRLGLPASVGSIARDTRDHYLPPRETEHAGRQGNSGLWEPWKERRAERLYRLRALDRRTNRGPSGDVLRLLLLIHDGWGFEYVKQTCVEGYRRLARGATRGVDNRVRKGQLTLDNVPFYAEDIATDQYRPKEPSKEQVQRVAFTLNTMLFGVDTGSGMGTLDDFMDELVQNDWGPEELAQWRLMGPLLRTILDPSVANVLRCAENAKPDTVARAAKEFRSDIYFIRRMFHAKFGRARDGGLLSSNPLTMLGGAAYIRLGDIVRNAPVRITPAQVLGGQFLIALAMVRRMDELAQQARAMVPILPSLLRAAAGEQAPGHPQSETPSEE